MRLIRYIFLSLVCSFSLCVKADTDYTTVLNSINQKLVNISVNSDSLLDFNDEIVLLLYDIINDVSNISTFQSGTLTTRLTQLVDLLSQMRDKISDLNFYVADIESYASYIIDIYGKTDSINSYLYHELGIFLSDMQDSLSSLDTFGDSLEDIIDAVNNCAGTAAQIALNQAELNQEETQKDILDALEDIKGRITVFPEEDIHTLVSIGNSILELLTETVRILQSFENTFSLWDEFYYRQFNGMGNFSIEYYHLLDSPHFSTGYKTQRYTAEYDSSGDFVHSLYFLLKGHLKLLESINDGILFLGKILSTNGQAKVEQDFQSQKDDVVNSLDSGYNQLRDYTYRGISYNLRDTKLYDVSSFISSFEANSYSAVSVYNVDISSFEVFGHLPTYFDFKYDLTPIASYLELVRNVFTIFWVLFFASFWIFLVSLFYRFYNFLYRLLCMVPGQSAPPPGPGLPVPSGGALMA